LGTSRLTRAPLRVNWMVFFIKTSGQWGVGVMEYWGNGFRIPPANNPALHYSITPFF
jgi:hypothetical protein